MEELLQNLTNNHLENSLTTHEWESIVTQPLLGGVTSTSKGVGRAGEGKDGIKAGASGAGGGDGSRTTDSLPGPSSF